jgi:hypothetical protein
MRVSRPTKKQASLLAATTALMTALSQAKIQATTGIGLRPGPLLSSLR